MFSVNVLGLLCSSIALKNIQVYLDSCLDTGEPHHYDHTKYYRLADCLIIRGHIGKFPLKDDERVDEGYYSASLFQATYQHQVLHIGSFIASIVITEFVNSVIGISRNLPMTSL
jgi:hypothetical protein